MVEQRNVLDLTGLICPLCHSQSLSLVGQNRQRSFFLCNECTLISVPPQQWVDPEQELTRYNLHDNALSNAGYVKYLSQVVEEVRTLNLRDPHILDFGSGPNAVLASLLQQSGFRVKAYDPLFGLELKRSETFDLIVICEVIEHLRDILGEIELIKSILNPHGYILIRTQLYPSQEKFTGWWYAQDSTHIHFFSIKSMHKVAELLGMELLCTGRKDFFILRRCESLVR